MKKQIYSLIIATSVVFCAHAANNPFAGLMRTIETSADEWVTTVGTLDIPQQLMYLNLFIQPSLSSVEATMKCIQEIQADSSLSKVSEQLEQSMQKIIILYMTHLQKKFESLKNNTIKNQKAFSEKLEKKIFELIGLFYNIYYTKLYNHIEKQDASVLQYMFDENGLIPAEKRTKLLPKPAA